MFQAEIFNSARNTFNTVCSETYHIMSLGSNIMPHFGYVSKLLFRHRNAECCFEYLSRINKVARVRWSQEKIVSYGFTFPNTCIINLSFERLNFASCITASHESGLANTIPTINCSCRASGS